MIGLDLIAGGLLHLAAFDVACKPRKLPTILIHPSRATVSYDFTKKRDELGAFDIDTVSPYGRGHNVKVGGLMEGEIRVESRIGQMNETFRYQKQGCVHIDSVTIIIHSNPVIYVASEYQKGSCQQRAIIEHEKKHVEIDRKIVNEFSGRLENKIRLHLRNTGYVYGPYAVSDVPRRQKDIQAELEKIIKAETKEMTVARQKAQQALDNAEEYDRVNRQCKR